MKSESGFTVQAMEWRDGKEPIRRLREEVFILEQAVPIDEEWDEYDAVSRYVIAVDERGRPLGTGRLSPDGKIGRMAVLKEHRRRGIGGAMLKVLLEMAKAEGHHTVFLHAQCQALEFYAKQEFTAQGPEFMEAGIPHRKMVLTLSRQAR
jgi:predicted GNAT family N-acyltransferase